MATPGSRILLYHDFASPFSRLAVELVARAAAERGLEVEPRPFELRPLPAPLPAPGDPAVTEELEAALPLAGRWGIELRPPAVVPRTRKAHEAVLHAGASAGASAARVQLATARALYDALWADGADIGRVDTVVAAAAAAGVDRGALHVALGLDEHGAAVTALQREAEAAGIEGVPTLVRGGMVAVGLLTPEDLAEWLDAG